MDIPFRNLRDNLPTCQGSNRIIRWLAQAVTVVLAVTVAAVMGQGAEETPLFSAQQAAEGKTLYAARCAACHGQTLQGGTAGPLAGPAFAAAWTLDGSLGAWADSQVTVDDLDFNIVIRCRGGRVGR